MLSSTLPRRSWELASYYWGTARHMEYLLRVRYVWACFHLYLVFTASFTVTLPASVPWWLQEIFGVLTPDWCYVTWWPNSSQGARKDLQASVTHGLSWGSIDLTPAHVYVCVGVCVYVRLIARSIWSLEGSTDASRVWFKNVLCRKIMTEGIYFTSKMYGGKAYGRTLENSKKIWQQSNLQYFKLKFN